MIKNSTRAGPFVDAIEESLALLMECSGTPDQSLVSELLPSLLEQCEAYCAAATDEPEPVRTLHHFACTGGTLIAKCIAAMPNTVLLSEIDPLSKLPYNSTVKKFSPTDLIWGLRSNLRPVGEETIEAVFLGGLLAMHKSLSLQGRRLVIRDHAHSQFCTRVNAADRPTVRDLVARVLPTQSLVTVRHPLDSFLSLQANGWVHFDPPTLEEYSLRYCAFLAAYEDIRIIRYEDLVSDVENRLHDICNALRMPCDPNAPELLSVISLSGDSGRSNNTIEPRSRRDIPEAVTKQAVSSLAYAKLCQELGYDPSPT